MIVLIRESFSTMYLNEVKKKFVYSIACVYRFAAFASECHLVNERKSTTVGFAYGDICRGLEKVSL